MFLPLIKWQQKSKSARQQLSLQFKGALTVSPGKASLAAYTQTCKQENLEVYTYKENIMTVGENAPFSDFTVYKPPYRTAPRLQQEFVSQLAL